MGFKDFWNQYKWWIIAAIAVIVIATTIIVVVCVTKQSSKPAGHEGFVASDLYADQFNYANSYIDSVLGMN